VFILTEVPSWRSVLAVTITALQLAHAVRRGFERKFGYRFAAFGALPVALVHLPRGKTTVILVKSHYAF
ncbi:MAG TPA: hypothetical protein VNK70_02945, partial [Candidatus Paceibacterota bacterium]|nr:hypothetical protein [Candidatus Paceibacterota bacterium]